MTLHWDYDFWALSAFGGLALIAGRGCRLLRARLAVLDMTLEPGA
jgi:hypothetical protein